MAILSQEQQRNAFAYIPCVLAPFSLAGCILILLSIFRTRQMSHHLRTYHRLMLGMSIFGIMLYLSLSLGPLPVPEAAWPYGGAHGNRASCTFQAILRQMGYGTYAYHAMFILNYLLAIRYNLEKKVISRRVEPLMHFIPIGYHVSTTILGLVWNVFNPLGPRCWIGRDINGCDVDAQTNECLSTREKVEVYSNWIRLPILVWFFMEILFTLMLAFTLWSRYLRTNPLVNQEAAEDLAEEVDSLGETSNKNYELDGDEGDDNIRTNVDNNDISNIDGEENNNDNAITGVNASSSEPSQARRDTLTRLEEQSRQVILQCFLYAGTMINNSLWISLGATFSYANALEIVEKNIWITIMSTIFGSIQGFFVFLIYFRPRYLSIRRNLPQGSRWFALTESVWYPIATHAQRVKRLSRRLQSGAFRPTWSTNNEIEHEISPLQTASRPRRNCKKKRNVLSILRLSSVKSSSEEKRNSSARPAD
jgi:hypothetical protein